MKTVLITGFRPFAGAVINPSWDAIELMAQSEDRAFQLALFELPVAFDEAASELLFRIEAYSPDVVIAVGLAEGRDAITVERVAVNIEDARIPDELGATPIDEAVVDGGPAAYFSTLPVKATVAALRDAGLPAAVSNTAGTYVCNSLFYALQHGTAAHPHVRSGFVHVPATPELGAGPEVPTMPLADIARALRIVIDTALTHDGPDLHVTGGTIS